ncbi:haloacid dehalogenase type II [Mesorhizobium sp. CAU 1732]|uniref:haloacid dehalogenase type II n=1 Tax=Mesorhizobium sp. CAU 1732 TaxID=3140358 RepID=UPI003261A91C
MSNSSSIKVLFFDVFGTVVDWYSQVVREGHALSKKTGVAVEWGEFARKWRVDGYLSSLLKISSGEMDLIPTEQIHRIKLDALLAEYGIADLDEKEIANFNRVWDRLPPWPDVHEGLHLLRPNYRLVPFSNGDLHCMIELARHGGLQWDAIVSADFFRKVKPDPTIYHDAANLMRLSPDEIMMVACHAQDLVGARRAGMRTAYVTRPLEYGPGSKPELKPEDFDYEVKDFIELAKKIA